MNFLSYDNPFGRFLYLVGDVVTLHFLWLVCSLPLFTIGASTTALYYSCMKRVRTDEGTVWRNFFHAFRQNFRQATILWLILLAVGGILALDLRIALAAQGFLGKLMRIGCSALLIPYLLLCLYIFPVQAKFENPVSANLKNAFLMSWHSFGYSALLVLITLTFLLLTCFFRPFMGLSIICGAGFYGYITASVFVQIFRRYLPRELEEDYEKTGLGNREEGF